MLAMAICESTYSPSATDHFDAETPAAKGEEKVSDQKCQKPSRNANFAKFSRENLAKFSSQMCVLRARFPVRRDVYVYVYIYIHVCVHMPIYIVIIV